MKNLENGGEIRSSSFRVRFPLLLFLLLCVLVGSVLAGTFNAFGPKTYPRETGDPVTVVDQFSVLNPSAEFTLRIYNGGLVDGEFEKVSSSVIKLNGVQIVGPDEFNQNVSLLEKPVSLLASNELSVEVRGKPGGAITLEIVGVDNDAPTISATASPAPNAAGWNNTDVTVSFSCTDATSGIATCPSPIIVATEGANQDISGTATDNAGNSATASVTVSLDKTSPTVVINSPADGTTLSGSSVTTAGTVNDALSGIATVTCNGIATSPLTSTFSCDVPLSEGSNSIVVEAGDLADNAGSATISVTASVDIDPPVITATITPEPNANGWNKADVTVSFDCQDADSGIADCPSPVTLTAEGLGQEVVGTATDQAGNTQTVTVFINIDKTPPTIEPAVSPTPNPNGWNNTDVTVGFAAEDSLSGVATVTPPVTLASEGANQVLDGTATDLAGNAASATALINIDKTPPAVAISSPIDRSIVRADNITVSGTVTEALSGVAAGNCDGVLATVSGSEFSCDVGLADGANDISAEFTDLAGNRGSASVRVTLVRAPTILITSPGTLTTVTTPTIDVVGVVEGTDVMVGVNGIAAAVSGGSFTAAAIPLHEGANTLTAVATDSLGNTSMGGVVVVLDTTAPGIFIDVPTDGAPLTQPSVTVTGRILDIAAATGLAEEVTVTVNGVSAQVSNGTFLAPDIPLQPGANAITATVRDSVGNSNSKTINVTLQSLVGQRINLVSGNNQSGVAGESLSSPLVVSLTDVNGFPVAGASVTFEVVRGDGTVTSSTDEGRTLSVRTDGSGHAQVSFKLGSRAGTGDHRVRATAAGFESEALFHAAAASGPPSGIKIVSGENQRGVVGQPLARPFIVFVHDQEGNPAVGISVEFQVTGGGGNLGGGASVTKQTGNDGRASVVLSLGPEPGLNNNVVQASFAGLGELPAVFIASGVIPGSPAATQISGVVLDNTNLPIEGVTVILKGTPLQTITDVQGQFALTGVVPGTHHLRVEGATANRPGVWPALEFEIEVFPGLDNTLGMPIFLLPLDDENAKIVGGNENVTLTMKDVPGFSLTVFANSATFRDGSRTGQVMVTQVHADKVPMPPQQGAAPRLVWTVQPEGVIFDPPAKVAYPNIYSMSPGQVVELFSFDHDIGEFVSIGTGSVSADGSVITSDPGVGILKAGWGFPPPQPPPPANCAKPVLVKIVSAPELLAVGQQEAILAEGSLDNPDSRCPRRVGSFVWSNSDTAVIGGADGATGNITSLAGLDSGSANIQVQYTVAGISTTASAVVKVAKVDLRIDSLPEESQPSPNEIDPGFFLWLNDDDDNGNGIPDKDETGPVTAEDDLITMAFLGFDESRPELQGGKLTLELTKGAGKVRVWTQATKGTELSLPKTWTIGVDQIPGGLFIEGINASLTERDIEFKLTFSQGNGTVQDTVLGTVVKLEFTPHNITTDRQQFVPQNPPNINRLERRIRINSQLVDHVARRIIKARTVPPLAGRRGQWSFTPVGDFRGFLPSPSSPAGHSTRFEQAADFDFDPENNESAFDTNGEVAVRLNVPDVPLNRGRLRLSLVDRLQRFKELEFIVPGTIVLDAGHGNGDVGAMGLIADGMQVLEANLTIDLAQRIETAVNGLPEAEFVRVRLTDRSQRAENRPLVARDENADMFLSIHFDSLAEGEAQPNRMDIFVRPETPQDDPTTPEDESQATPNVNEAEDIRFARAILDAAFGAYALNDAMAEDGGVRLSPLRPLRDGGLGNTQDFHPVVSALLEVGFLRNETFHNRWNVEGGRFLLRDLVAGAIAREFVNQLRQPHFHYE